MADLQAPEQELVAKLSAGGTNTEEVIGKALAEYLTKKSLDTYGLNPLEVSDANATALGDYGPGTTPGSMMVASVMLGFTQVITIALITYPFASGYNHFVALFFGQAGAGYGEVQGKMNYVPQNVGRAHKITSMKKNPETNVVELKCCGYEFSFAGPVGSLNIDKEYTNGAGFYFP